MEYRTYTTGTSGKYGKMTPVFFEIFGFVLAIISFIISLIPCIGYFALIPAVLGFVFCFVGWMLKRKDEQNAGLAIAGVIVGFLAILISLYQYQKYKEVHDGIQEIKETFNDAIYNGLEESVYNSIDTTLTDSLGNEIEWEPVYIEDQD